MGKWSTYSHRGSVRTGYALGPVPDDGWSVASPGTNQIVATRTESYPPGVGQWGIRTRPASAGNWGAPIVGSGTTLNAAGSSAVTYLVQAAWFLNSVTQVGQWSEPKSVLVTA